MVAVQADKKGVHSKKRGDGKTVTCDASWMLESNATERTKQEQTLDIRAIAN